MIARPARAPLPIDPLIPEILEALGRHPSVVVEAPPGAGKTTRVPMALLESGLIEGEILVLQPRRLPTRLAAQRVASELGERIGERVGYSLRFDQVGGPRTRLRFVTEGILTRRLLADPGLRGVGAVVLDEFHERHLAGDLGLALLRRLQREGRPELRLVVMSATLAAGPVAAFLGDAPRLRSEGRSFELEIRHQERPDDRPLPEQVAGAVKRLLQEGLDGDVLVFLPGAAEIRRAAEALSPIAEAQSLLVLPLHGDLPTAEQDRAVAPADRRKVILSTNVAETSLTIDGIAAVVDSGLARIAAHSPWSGLPTLEVGKISQASAIQRAGRAGRTRAGLAIRLYSRNDFASRAERDPPEIHRLDLAELLLSIRGAGVSDPSTFGWFEPPLPAAVDAADSLLRRLGALDEAGALLPIGRRLLRLPIHPRLGRIVVEGERHGVGADACVLAALTAERDLRQDSRISFGGGRARAAAAGSSDLLELLERFREAERARFAPQRLRSMGLDPRAVDAVDRSRRQLERLLRDPDRDAAGREAKAAPMGGGSSPGGARGGGAQSVGPGNGGARSGGLPSGGARGSSPRIGGAQGGWPRGGVAERAPQSAGPPPGRGAGGTIDPAHEEALLQCVLAGFPDRVARRRGPTGRELLLAAGGSAELAEASVVHDSTFIVAVAAEERSGRQPGARAGLIRLASAIEPEWLLDLHPDEITECEEWIWNDAAERVDRLSQLRYDAIAIEESRGPAAPSARTAEVLAKAAIAKGISAFAGDGAADAALIRLQLAREAMPEAQLPALGGADLEAALSEACEGLRSFAELRERSIPALLLSRLGPEQQRLLARELPERLALPGGKSVPIHYEPGRPPWIESRLQDFFGMIQSPAIARGRVPLTVHLLAPNHRAVQVTSDLAGFWERHYPGIRKELSRRYPRHAWPEDGRSAKPPAGGRIR